LAQLLDNLRSAGLTVSLDTNDDPTGVWRGILDLLLERIDILLPNEDELLQIAGATTVEQALDMLATRVPLIVVKCGTRGALVQWRNQRHYVAPLVVQPVDTIGAGDSFNAGFLNAWLAGEDPVRAAAKGNLTGALSTLRPGGVAALSDARLRKQFFSGHALK
jgi:sugar/nucleoside kinase (ribokinase family)